MIRYHDTIVWTAQDGNVRETIPATVYGTDAAAVNDEGYLRSRLAVRAIIPRTPGTINAGTDRVRWRGMSLRLVGLPIPRMRRGTVHHYTLELEALT